MMKKGWLLWILAGIMSVSFASCADNSEGPSGGNSGGSQQQQPLYPDSSSGQDPDYGLGDNENENEEDWWNNSGSTDPDDNPGETPPEDSEVSGETLPY
jgi:hypothetical protein